MLRALRDFFWPVLDRIEDDEARRLSKDESAEIERIEGADFSTEAATALEAANKIYTSEDERVRSSETKAFYLLLVAAALVPLLTYLESAIWDGKIGTAPKWLSLSILALAVLYFIGAAYWALRAVSVRNYHTIGTGDLVTTWTHRNPIEKLAKETLVGALRNQRGVNEKVSAVKMATGFLLRTIYVFCLLLLVQIGWEISTVVGPQLKRFVCG